MTTLTEATRSAAEVVQSPHHEPLIVDRFPQCWRCKRTLGEYFARPWSLKCQRCGANNRSEPAAE